MEKLKLVEQDGTEYGRMDDEFITDYGMQRLPGTDLNFGSYEGWVCYQIPETAGELSLVYSFQEEEFQTDIIRTGSRAGKYCGGAGTDRGRRSQNRDSALGTYGL